MNVVKRNEGHREGKGKLDQQLPGTRTWDSAEVKELMGPLLGGGGSPVVWGLCVRKWFWDLCSNFQEQESDWLGLEAFLDWVNSLIHKCF